MPKKSKKWIETKATIADAVSGAHGEMISLGEEMREIFDNAPENLQQTSVNQAREQAADECEQLSEVDVPEELGKIEITWTEKASGRRGLSRPARQANAVIAVEAAINALEEIRDKLDEKKELSEEEQSKRDEAESLIDELENWKSEAEAVEFPGMYG